MVTGGSQTVRPRHCQLSCWSHQMEIGDGQEEGDHLLEGWGISPQ